jgi:CspA family cold shock protein
MATGVVKFFVADKGFGFITPDGGGNDVFVHAKEVEAAQLGAILKEGDRVQFDLVDSTHPRRKPGDKKAAKIRRA